ncbi:HET-domain-containing protein, partial [Saccharata proteae CBS 121410]
MRLINCTNRTLEPAAPDKKYAALSYVWGSPKEAPTSQARSPFRVGDRIMVMERTIEDALLVALEMGLDYIWVDRYCINQSDPSKHRQIRQMDTIYNNAELTIVAAAGDDPTSGLPGVSSAWPRPNPKLESYRMGNIIIFEDPDYGIDVYANFGPELAKSPWGQRAWTFQEGMFSRRCLVFMEKLTAFTC